MKTIIVLASLTCLTAGLTQAQNLLLNGDFNSQNIITSTNGSEYYGATPDDWTVWTYPGDGNEWANRQMDVANSYDGSFYMAIGNNGNTGDASGVYQIVSATAGVTYDLAVKSGAQNWWWPKGEMTLTFMDDSSDILDQSVLDVTTAITGYDTGLSWQEYSLNALAPAGTTQAKIEFETIYNSDSGGGGTVFFDNATLMATPEPSTWVLLAIGGVTLLGFRRAFCQS